MFTTAIRTGAAATIAHTGQDIRRYGRPPDYRPPSHPPVTDGRQGMVDLRILLRRWKTANRGTSAKSSRETAGRRTPGEPNPGNPGSRTPETRASQIREIQERARRVSGLRRRRFSRCQRLNPANPARGRARARLQPGQAQEHRLRSRCPRRDLARSRIAATRRQSQADLRQRRRHSLERFLPAAVPASVRGNQSLNSSNGGGANRGGKPK